MTGAPGETPLGDREEVDLLVIGSGAGGLAAAVTAAKQGLRVKLVEKAPRFGGTTAWSGGWMWIPGNPLAARTGGQRKDCIDRARAYLLQHLGPQTDPNQAARIEAYLSNGPVMIEFFHGLPEFEFELGSDTADFSGSDPGEGARRTVRARAVNSKRLGADFDRLRKPLDMLTIWRMGIETGRDLAAVLRIFRWPLSLPALARVSWSSLRHFKWLLGLGKRLVNGQALAARLLLAARRAGVDLQHSSQAEELLAEQGTVVGARIKSAGLDYEVRSRLGVVLACGGFPHDAKRLAGFVGRRDFKHWSAAPATNTGDGLRLGVAVGAVVGTQRSAPAMWAPVSLLRRTDGSTDTYPHLIDRGKPGVIAVKRSGTRFCNEACGYHDFVVQWLAATPPDEPLEAWLICDAVFLKRYGLGAVKPPQWMFSRATRWAKRVDYLKSAASIEALASACGIDPQTLPITVALYNEHAREGRDPAFRRGESDYDQSQGDPLSKPNPCVAPIEHAPFYAVRLQPGSLGTLAGLTTHASGQVLGLPGEADQAGAPIPGLYACGNDMASPMGGFYPSSGLTLGAAMTFGYVIGRQVTDRYAATASRDESGGRAPSTGVPSS